MIIIRLFVGTHHMLTTFVILITMLSFVCLHGTVNPHELIEGWTEFALFLCLLCLHQYLVLDEQSSVVNGNGLNVCIEQPQSNQSV